LILQAIAEGKITQEEVDDKIKRILKAKFWAGLDQRKPIDTYKLAERINRPEAYYWLKSFMKDPSQ
jgi:beta-N-acetylhexosaminidase